MAQAAREQEGDSNEDSQEESQEEEGMGEHDLNADNVAVEDDSGDEEEEKKE